MELIGYVAAVAVIAFGIYVVRRLIVSWRGTYRTDAEHRAGDARGAERDPEGGTPSG